MEFCVIGFFFFWENTHKKCKVIPPVPNDSENPCFTMRQSHFWSTLESLQKHMTLNCDVQYYLKSCAVIKHTNSGFKRKDDIFPKEAELYESQCLCLYFLHIQLTTDGVTKAMCFVSLHKSSATEGQLITWPKCENKLEYTRERTVWRLTVDFNF